MESVLFEKDGPIGQLTLNRPDERNALSVELMKDMLDKLNAINQDQNIHLVVIKGEGSAFCAGHNLKDMVGTDLGIQHFYTFFALCAKMMQAIQKLPQPVIVQAHGIAAAEGCQLVAACDLAVAIIALGKEAQARKSMRFFFDDRLINELAKAGKRIAKKDVNDI